MINIENNKRIITNDSDVPEYLRPGQFNAKDMIRLPDRFSGLSKLILRDLNDNQQSPSFYKYTKDQIATFINNPYTNEQNIRNAVVYLYNVSSHFRRLIQYFTGLSDLSYVVSPYKIDTSSTNPKTLKRNYQRVLNAMCSFSVKNQFAKILTVCLREDVFYGTMHVSDDSIIIQQLPSNYCVISSIEDNVPNIAFDFSYFDLNPGYLSMYPEEFDVKYKIYQRERNARWQELDSPTSFAVKCNNDILNYAIPPFVGILREIYDIEDYKALKMTKTELENYAILVMKLGINADGDWEMDLDKAKSFWRNLDSVLPEEVGSILTPMPIEKIGFEKSNVGDTDVINEAEENLFTAAGVSSLLFNNRKASGNALLLSIKADQAMTYGIVKGIEAMVNRYIHNQPYGKNFMVTFLDCSPFNRKEMGDAYIKACQFGLPMVSYFAASQGMMQSELDGMNFLENDVLHFPDRFVPLHSSSTQSAENDTGRPTKDIDELSDSGEASRELEGDDVN